MPEITSIATAALGSYFSEEFNAERSSGCHLMEIIEDLETRVVKRQNPRFDRESMDRFALLGFIWERLIGRALSWVETERRPNEIVRPGEQFADGIYGTPDAFNIRQWVLEEWKATWRRAPKSEAEFEERHWKWLVQVLCYCYLLGCSVAIIRVFYVMGDWSMSNWSGPQIMSFRIESSEEERREAWEMVLNHKRTMEAEGTASWVVN